MLVEPEIRNFRILQRLILQNEHLELVRTFKGGRQTLQYLRANPVDILFLNPELRDLSGFEVLRLARDIPTTILVSDRYDYAYYGYQLGTTGFLTPPITASEFRKVLAQAEQKIKLERCWERFGEEFIAELEDLY